MELVGPPTRSDIYSIEADGGSAYVPGGLVTIHIRVTQPTIQSKRYAGMNQCECSGNRCPSMRSSAGGCNCTGNHRRCNIGAAITEPSKYLGLLMYAVREGDPTEAKLGSWEFPIEADAARFQSMTGADCEGKAVVQTSAIPKRYHERFWFRAPAAGTGPIVLRALVKQGDTLGGAFYWPTAVGATSSAANRSRKPT